MLQMESKINQNQIYTEFSFFVKGIICIFAFVLAVATPNISISINKITAQKSVTLMEEIDRIISLSQGASLRNSLSLYLIDKVSEGKMPDDTCMPFIPSLNTYLREDVENIVQTRVNYYIKRSFEKDSSLVPIIDT